MPRRKFKFFYTYVLQSLKDGNFYSGYTNDLIQRLEQHNNGLSFATKSRRPFILVYYEACKNEEDAQQRERYLKTGVGKRYIKNRLKKYLLT